MCVLCGNLEESTIHLFLHCEVTNSIRHKVMTWLGILFITPPNLFIHWECWGLVGGIKRLVRDYG